MLSPSLEDYLEEIYRFLLQKSTVRVTDIGRKLNVAVPSVTRALGKLKAQNYIIYQPYEQISLTEKGKELGKFLVNRNQIIQDFLTLLGVACNVAAEAEAIEHYLSVSTIETFHRLADFLRENPDLYIKLQTYLKKEPADKQ
ncbi:iron dependent repressor [Lucifera butyrica]|uniref:Iron dependent repressor n=1 Tax=Lucifera butyrica TaxID=1351585 RepID=A0A498RFP9_9FIRM|nr:iron dependent repressor, metal binding and dimerization domain protein [Lucifera butyrica]VBB09777.1 iron dependent repressor [Lucifera butyrica]